MADSSVFQQWEKQQMQQPQFQDGYYKFSTFLLEDGSFPAELKASFWAFADKEVALTNLSPVDIQKIQIQVDDAILAHLMTKPDYEYDYEEESQLSEMRSKIFFKINRSKEGFERRSLVTQIRQMLYEEQQPRASGGIASGVGKIFGMGRK